MSSLHELLQPHLRGTAIGIFVAAAVVFPVLVFIPAPYGRHYRPGWGPALGPRLSWVLMEWPSWAAFAVVWWLHPHRMDPLVLALGLAYLVHYTQRVFVYALLQRGGKPNPLLTVAMAVVFNLANATGNAAALAPRPPDAPFFAGLAVMLLGFVLNLHSDAVLRALRKPGESGYKIPFGGAYRWVSSPNYLGELLEWVGFAVAAQNLNAWAFAAFTVANLAPRAWAHHKWYRGHFADYPKERKALLPYLW